MRLRKSSGKQRKLKPLLLRRVVGNSMTPRLSDGEVVVASGWFRSLRPHDIVIVRHDGREKIKRVHQIEDGKLFLLGDNGPQSTDSRHFGWVDGSAVLGKVLWPRLDQAVLSELSAAEV